MLGILADCLVYLGEWIRGWILRPALGVTVMDRNIYTRHVERLILNEHALRHDRRTQQALNVIIGCLLILVGLAAWWGLGRP